MVSVWNVRWSVCWHSAKAVPAGSCDISGSWRLFRDAVACMPLFSSILTACTLVCLWSTKRLQLWRPITGLSAKFCTSLWHFVFSVPCSIWDITKQSPMPCSRPHLEFCSLWLFSSELAKTIIMVLESSWFRKKNEFYDDVRAPKFINPFVLILLILWNVIRITSSFCNTDAHNDHGHIIIVCKKVSATAFLCILKGLGSLALWSCTIIFCARKLPDT